MDAKAKDVTFWCQYNRLGFMVFLVALRPKYSQEPTITCPLSGGCHWYTPEMYQERSGVTSWEARGNVSAQATAGTLSSPKGWKLKKEKKCLKLCFCQAIKGKSRTKTCVLNKDFGGKWSFLFFICEGRKDLWGYKCSPTFDKRLCTGLNASVWRVIKHCWSIHPSRSHTVTVWMNLVKGQAVSWLLLPCNRRENTMLRNDRANKAQLTHPVCASRLSSPASAACKI